MLVDPGNASLYESLVRKSQQRLEIPEEHRARLEQQPSVTAFPGDKRRFQRAKFHQSAVFVYGGGLPAFPRKAECHLIQFVDLCRGGVGFLHCEQLYPGETMQIMVATGSVYSVEIMNCRRIGARCYHVGARFNHG